jgi:hypothetical protein
VGTHLQSTERIASASSNLVIPVQPRNSTVQCFSIYLQARPALPFTMVAGIPAQIATLLLRSPTATSPFVYAQACSTRSSSLARRFPFSTFLLRAQLKGAPVLSPSPFPAFSSRAALSEPVNPLSTAFTSIRLLSPLSTVLTQNTRAVGSLLSVVAWDRRPAIPASHMHSIYCELSIRSLPSSCASNPLESATCSLFCKNIRGGGIYIQRFASTFLAVVPLR